MLCGDCCSTTENKNRENLSSVQLVSFQPSNMMSEAWLWKTEQVEGCAFGYRDDSEKHVSEGSCPDVQWEDNRGNEG